VSALKQQPGGDIVVHGSGQLVDTLMRRMTSSMNTG
jgi:acetylglutamate kinase